MGTSGRAVALAGVLALSTTALAHAGVIGSEFTEMGDGLTSGRGLMWLTVTMLFAGSLGFGIYKLYGHQWWDGVKSLLITGACGIFVATGGVRLTGQMLAQAATVDPPAITDQLSQSDEESLY